jgi:tellurite methyltransferase
MTMQKDDDRKRWNAKFLAGEAQSFDPDPLIVEIGSSLPRGRALDLAGGAGRHALWLAQRGWDVTLADVADEGLAIGSMRAAENNVALATRRESAGETLAWAAQQPFDLVVVIWCLLRDQFPTLPSALAPGGTLLYKTYTTDHERYRTGHSLRTALNPGELQGAFPALRTILYREEGGVAELVARAE